MTFLVSSDPLLPGAFAVRAYPGFGILGADVPEGGDSGQSPVLNDTGFSPDGEYYWFVETPPSAGNLILYPDLTFEFSDAPVGEYTWTYRVGDQTGESATVGTVAISVLPSAVSTIMSGATLTGTSTISGGSFDAQRNVEIPGAVLTGDSTIEGGTFEAQRNVEMPGATLDGTSTIEGGTFVVDNEATVIPGATLTATSDITGGSFEAQRNVEMPGAVLTGTSNIDGGSFSTGEVPEIQVKLDNGYNMVVGVFVKRNGGYVPAVAAHVKVGGNYLTV